MYLGKINYTYLTTSCMSAFCMSAYPNQEINFARLLMYE
ncbi:hypothetical protein MAN88_14900 [Microcystis aeruginosa]|jgi:hypothetical protein|nr:hypothetical protein MAN88_14900 [Microcystis aeruginosa]